MDDVNHGKDAELGQGQGADSEGLKPNNAVEEAVEAQSSTTDLENSLMVDRENVEIIKTSKNDEDNLNLVSEAELRKDQVEAEDDDNIAVKEIDSASVKFQNMDRGENKGIAPTHTSDLEEEYDQNHDMLHMIRVKFLRLAHRLGQSRNHVVVAQVLHRLGLAEELHGTSGGRVAAFSSDRAIAVAEKLEAAGPEPLDFTCTIMVLGKSGVGKSATINSIFDQAMVKTDAFRSGTNKVEDFVGTVQGIKVRVIDTPGLSPCWSDQPQNEKILHSIKKFIKKTPPDIVLYLDRLDMQSGEYGDISMLRTMTELLGASIWLNAIVVLTHAATAPPEGPKGNTISYDTFVTQRSNAVLEAIRQVTGNMQLMNPISLVENHSACRKNQAGQRVLPNGLVWKPHLLLLSFASKILAEANKLLQLQDGQPGRRVARPRRSPYLSSLLSSLLKSKPQVKVHGEPLIDDDDDEDEDEDEDDLDEWSDSEEVSEFDELPPFKTLTKAQLAKLTKLQREAYYDELEYRARLFMKKQLSENKKWRKKMMKKMKEEEYNDGASNPAPLPDLQLPHSFDSDNPAHRYRSLDTLSPWAVRYSLHDGGWDHNIGVDGLILERSFVVKHEIPVSFSSRISTSFNDTNLEMKIASAVKHGKGKATSLGFDMKSVGNGVVSTLRSETRFLNHRDHKAFAGLSTTLSGNTPTGGLKLEDKIAIGKWCHLVACGGAVFGLRDIACGANLEATIRDRDDPLGRFLSTLGLSLMNWRGTTAIGCNSQIQVPVGRHTDLIGRVEINDKGFGEVSIRINSSEQLELALIGLIPLISKLLGLFKQVLNRYR